MKKKTDNKLKNRKSEELAVKCSLESLSEYLGSYISALEMVTQR